MKNLLILALICTFISSCAKTAQEEVTTNNRNFKVELLFEVDGCKVYRFIDNGYRYFSNCSGEIYWKEGKNQIDVNIPTSKK